MPREDGHSRAEDAASPSPAFVAHLARFAARATTPNGPSPSPCRPTSTSPAQTQPSIKRPTPTRRRSTATPPRPDGSSPHFLRKTSDLDLGEGRATTLQDAPSPSKKPKMGNESLIDDVTETDPPSHKKKKRPARPYADPSLYAELGDNPLVDYLKPDLDVLLCGINPGLTSARRGQHYASPTNHFWKALAGSGLTDRLLHPSEGPILPDAYGIGSTNLVPRPSAEMSELSNEEMRACVPALLRKIVLYRPRMVAFVGMKICETVFRYLYNLPSFADADDEDHEDVKSPRKRRKRKAAMPKVKIGLQPVTISLARLDDGDTKSGSTDGQTRKIHFWCVPSTSARVVSYQLVDKIRIFGELKADVARLGASALEPSPGTIDYPIDSLLLASEADERPRPARMNQEVGGPWKVTLVEKIDEEGAAVRCTAYEPTSSMTNSSTDRLGSPSDAGDARQVKVE
ncbi:hypothetical protein JCM10212_004449 [Sporobolomyces blumeae]